MCGIDTLSMTLNNVVCVAAFTQVFRIAQVATIYTRYSIYSIGDKRRIGQTKAAIRQILGRIRTPVSTKLVPDNLVLNIYTVEHVIPSRSVLSTLPVPAATCVDAAFTPVATDFAQ